MFFRRKNKKVVYTAITGGYDSLLKPKVVNRRWDYICFTDSDILVSDFWEIINIKDLGMDPIRTARYYKIMPHIVLSEYEESLWVDGNFLIVGDIDKYVSRYSKNSPILCIAHSSRNNVYSEAEACIALNKDTKENIEEQMERYRKKGYPRNSRKLIESGILYRKHQNKELIKIMEIWWDEVKNYSYRDQLSFNYSSWINNFEYDEAYVLYHKNEFFERETHDKDSAELSPLKSDLFWAKDMTFSKSEFKSEKVQYNAATGEFSVEYLITELDNFANPNRVRFDPASHEIKVILEHARIHYEDHNIESLPLVWSNYTSWDEGYMVFNHDDPRFVFETNEISFKNATHFSFEGIVFPASIADSKIYFGNGGFSEENTAQNDVIINSDGSFEMVFDRITLPYNFSFTSVRFDPAERKLKMNLTNADIVNKDGSMQELKLLGSNKSKHYEGNDIFLHNDPWYKYKIEEKNIDEIKEIIFKGNLEFLDMQEASIQIGHASKIDGVLEIDKMKNFSVVFGIDIKNKAILNNEAVTLKLEQSNINFYVEAAFVKYENEDVEELVFSSANNTENNYEFLVFKDILPCLEYALPRNKKRIREIVFSGIVLPYIEEFELEVEPELEESREYSVKTNPIIEEARKANIAPKFDFIKERDELVDIIVCIHNAYDDVKVCLETLYKNTSNNFRLIAVDDGSDDKTKSFVKRFCESKTNTTLIRNEQGNGYTIAANMGLRASDGPYVVLLNSDTIVTEGWLDNLYQCSNSRSDIGIVGPLSNAASWQSVPELSDPVEGGWSLNPLPDNVSLDEFAQQLRNTSKKEYPIVTLLNGFCLMLKREVIEKIGYLDEEHFPRGYGEEDDYNIRAQKAGFRLAVADDTYVFHAKSKSYSNEKKVTLSKLSRNQLELLHGKKTLEQLVKFMKNSWVFASIRNSIKNILADLERKNILTNINILAITGKRIKKADRLDYSMYIDDINELEYYGANIKKVDENEYENFLVEADNDVYNIVFTFVSQINIDENKKILEKKTSNEKIFYNILPSALQENRVIDFVKSFRNPNVICLSNKSYNDFIRKLPIGIKLSEHITQKHDENIEILSVCCLLSERTTRQELEEMEKFKKLIEVSGNQNVEIIDLQSLAEGAMRQELAKRLKATSILLDLSHYDNYTIPSALASACVPFVLKGRAGIKDQINGFVFDKANADDFYATYLLLLRNRRYLNSIVSFGLSYTHTIDRTERNKIIVNLLNSELEKINE